MDKECGKAVYSFKKDGRGRVSRGMGHWNQNLKVREGAKRVPRGRGFQAEGRSRASCPGRFQGPGGGLWLSRVDSGKGTR